MNNTEKENGQFALRNDFIRMPKSFSAPVLQTFGLILSKIEWTKDNTENDFIRVAFTIKEVMKACGSSSRDYRYYMQFVEELQNKAWIKIETDDTYKRFNLFPEVEADNKEVKVIINNRLNEFVQMLTSNFTVFQIAKMSKFQSRFSYILYMNLCSWNDHSRSRKDLIDERTRYYTTKELKEMFDMKEDDYCRKNGKFDRKAFEDRVVNKAIGEINEKSDIRAEWKKEYNGRKVKCYVFHWYRKDVEEDQNTGLFTY